MSEIDFSAISAQVMDHLNSGATTDSVAATVPESTAAPQAPVAPAADPSSVQPQTPAPQAPQTYRLDLGEGERDYTAEDIKRAYLRQQDYTRKTQELAAQRQQLEQAAPLIQQAIQERAQLLELVQNPQLYAQYMAQLQAQQAPQINPNDIATLGEVQQLTQYQAQQMAAQLQQVQAQTQQNIAQAVQQGIQYLQTQQEAVKLGSQVDQHLAKIYEEQPVLKAVPEFEELMRYRVEQMRLAGQIQSPEQALQAFTTVASDLARALTPTGTASPAVTPAAQAPAPFKVGMLPPGGVPPQPQPQSFMKKDRTVDWGALNQAALGYMNGLTR